MPNLAIRAEKLGKRYQLYERSSDRVREALTLWRRTYHRGFWALQDLDLEVSRGECIGLVGPNGAGKSTTLKIIAGKLKPTTGTVTVNGRVSSILELGTGFSPDLSGRQNARVNVLFLGQRPWDVERHVDRILEFAEIGTYADQPLSKYSSGMQARLAFSVLTTLDPEILILDEALATGDANFAAKCKDHLRRLCSSGCTTLVASHDIGFLAKTCSRIVWIAQGRKVAEGLSDDIAGRYMEKMSVGDEFGHPRYALLRIEAEDARLDPTFVIHCVEWLDATGGISGEHYLGDDSTWDTLSEAATHFGFTPHRASKGWEGIEVSRGVNRRCRPRLAPDGTVNLVVPLPRALPSKIRVTLKHDAPCHAVLTLQAGGLSRELGRIGRQGTVPPGTPPPEDFPRLAFDVEHFFRDDAQDKAAPESPVGAGEPKTPRVTC
jgi:ABC-type polysaccharide/polyol phosphate transport system ATPase subunit